MLIYDDIKLTSTMSCYARLCFMQDYIHNKLMPARKSIVINSSQIIYLFFYLFELLIYLALWGLSCGTWDINSLVVAWGVVAPKDQTHVPCIAKQILKHRTIREAPFAFFNRKHKGTLISKQSG